MTTIPDSIEPVRGYKALAMNGDHLYSPQQNTEWPHGKALESECSNTSIGFTVNVTWKLVPTPPGWPQQEFWISADQFKRNSTIRFPWPTEGPPPDGYTFVPEHQTHSMHGCSCGIYMVSDPKDCKPYLNDTDRVIAEVAGWGQTIVGTQGWRVQYAYPQLLYAHLHHVGQAERIADKYGIPIELV